IVIEIVVPALLKSGADEFPFPKMPRLWSAISPRQTMCGRLRHHCMDHTRLVALAKHERVAADPVAAGIVCKVTHDGIECAGKVNIVAIDKSENVSGGPFETFVDRVHLAAILFTHPVRQLVFVAPNDGDTVVGT